jgi:predicted PurR-regulated permease PerM
MNSTIDILLILVYLFTILFYRTHFKKFFIKLYPEKSREEVVGILEKSVTTALQYLKGKMILVGLLAVIYSVGLTLIGVKFSIFYGILASLLSLIPYIGNLIGGGLPFLTALLYGNTTSALLVIALFTVVQFIESYVLQPLVVGKQVDLNPMMTILIVILAGVLWGIPGMIIAIPYLGIVMVLFSHIPGMEPWAFLLRKESDES